jgi:predicted acetyltransferase
VRLIDVGAALSGRSYATDAPLVFDVRDAFCPWNEGRWRLENGEASRTSDAADLALDVADLGSVYLGGFTFRGLQRAGRVEELTDGAVYGADATFRTEGLPWCPEIF